MEIQEKIERITNDAYSERFYKAERINPRTNNHYFPAFHFVTSLGSPESFGLSEWKKNKGHFSDYLLERSAEIGSYVHDCIDRMIKTNVAVTHDEIEQRFPDPKEAEKAKLGLLGFLNFIRDEEPEIISSEKKGIGEDFGFTLDLEARVKKDGYKAHWVLDWKTSKVVNDDHKMQVEAIRRVIGADKAGIIVLGNTTKKKYTFTEVKKSEQDYLFDKWQAIKETAYVEMLKRGTIQPREDTMPLQFSLTEYNLKRLFID